MDTLNYLVYHMYNLILHRDPAKHRNFSLDGRLVFRFGVHKKDFEATKVQISFFTLLKFRLEFLMNMLAFPKFQIISCRLQSLSCYS
jgi:hypothetical protein